MEVVEYTLGGGGGGGGGGAGTSSPSLVRLCLPREPPAVLEGTALPPKSTGTTVWPAALVLSRYLTSNPRVLAEKRVLELGAGSGLSGLVAARYSKEVWLTDKDDQVLSHLERTVRLNPDVAEKVRVEKLVWGEETPKGPAGRSSLAESFDAILASDTLYYYTAVEPFWRSVDALLSRTRCADGSLPLVVVAHVNREKLIDTEMLKVGQRLGFVAQGVPLSTLYPPGGEPLPTNEHVSKQMLRLFIFTRAQHLSSSK